MKERNKVIKIVVLYLNVSIYMYSQLHFREKYEAFYSTAFHIKYFAFLLIQPPNSIWSNETLICLHKLQLSCTS